MGLSSHLPFDDFPEWIGSYWHAESHAYIAALGQERRLIPEAVKIDVVVQSTTLLSRLDDLVET